MVFRKQIKDNEIIEVSFQPGSSFAFNEDRIILNPGSVGQPRDGDPRASYVLYDSDLHTASLYRIDYPIDIVQQEMVRVGLPNRMAERLDDGW
jgi:diadenosine tetraphosphatase ApaH/serine/threonine PP2A family protein phosphatase